MADQLTLPAPLLLRTAPPAHQARPLIAQLRAAGHGWETIARHLNASGVATPTGRGRWHSSTVYRTHEPARWAAYQRDYRARRKLVG